MAPKACSSGGSLSDLAYCDGESQVLRCSPTGYNFYIQLQILRVGTTRVKYVSLPHSRPWVIHNYKDTRGRGQVTQTVSSNIEEDKLFISKNNTTSLGGQKVASERKTTQTKASTTTENSADSVDHPQITSTTQTKASTTTENSADSVDHPQITSTTQIKASTTTENSADTVDHPQITSTTQTKASTTTENSAGSVYHPQITSRDLTANTPSVTLEAEKGDVRNADCTSGNRVSSATTQTECVESQAIVDTESESVVGEPEVGRGGSGSGKLINSRVGPYTRSKSTKKKPQTDADSVAAGPKALSTYEKIRLQIVPWKKPEGYLNKPVFSFMVESILLYIVSNPGISFTDLCARYNPFLLPCHLRDLLEILEEMECVSRTIVTTDPVLSVFSAYQPPNIVLEPDQSLDNEEFYEATVHSLPLLGQFLEDVQNTDSVQLHRTRKSMKSETGTSSNQEESEDMSNHGNRTSIVTGEGMSSDTISTQLLHQSGQGQQGSQTLEPEQGGGGKDTSRNAQEATVEEVSDPSHEKMDTSGPQSVDQCFSMDMT